MRDEKVVWRQVLENTATRRQQEVAPLLLGKTEEEARRKRALYRPPRANLLHPSKWPADPERNVAGHLNFKYIEDYFDVLPEILNKK